MSKTDGTDFRTASDLRPAVAEALRSWGMALADTKYWMGRRLSEWVNGAPALEAAVGAAAMTQDELGHARSLFAMLRDLPGAPPELGSDADLARKEYYNPSLLATPWESWMEAIAVNVLLDQALSTVIQSTLHSRYGPLRGRSAKILQEEHFHRVFGKSWLARVAAMGGRARNRMQEALDRVWPVASGWFGPPDDTVAASLVAAGILEHEPAGLREAWTAQVGPLLKDHEFRMPSSNFDWSQWNPTRREVTHA